MGLATALAEKQTLVTPLLVAGDDPLVVCKDACFSKLVHTEEGFWRRVVVEEVKFVRGQFDSFLAPPRHRVHPASQLVKDAHRPVPPDYLLKVSKV